ncbi:MAG: hypothetical protein LBT22_02080 [Peptococcaceae bacterium]|nr:hypothetical protein [Peptococcaceae bacterium]
MKLDLVTAAKKFLTACGIDWPVKAAFQNEKTAAAVFDPKRKEFRINMARIFQLADKQKMKPEDSLILALCHEIGYYADPQFEELTRTIDGQYRQLQEFQAVEAELMATILQREIQARNLGQAFVPERLRLSYRQAEERNLQMLKQRSEVEILECKQKCQRLRMSESDIEYYARE